MRLGSLDKKYNFECHPDPAIFMTDQIPRFGSGMRMIYIMLLYNASRFCSIYMIADEPPTLSSFSTPSSWVPCWSQYPFNISMRAHFPSLPGMGFYASEWSRSCLSSYSIDMMADALKFYILCLASYYLLKFSANQGARFPWLLSKMFMPNNHLEHASSFCSIDIIFSRHLLSSTCYYQLHMNYWSGSQIPLTSWYVLTCLSVWDYASHFYIVSNWGYITTHP